MKYLSTHNGITVHHVDTTDVDIVRSFVNENTALVLLESPTNPLIKVVDIPSISRITRDASPRALVVVDNTMLSPYLQNPLELGADIVYESGTKYLSGHHDLMAGVIAVQDSALGEVPALSPRDLLSG
jgi:cysteine-S-conjugate beta-lyase